MKKKLSLLISCTLDKNSPKKESTGRKFKSKVKRNSRGIMVFKPCIEKLIYIFTLLFFVSNVSAQKIVIGKDAAPINEHDYAVLKEIAKDAGVDVSVFVNMGIEYSKKYFIIGPDSLLYVDENQSLSVDENEKPTRSSIALGNSYITDPKGHIVAISIDGLPIKKSNIFNSLSNLVAIDLDDVNLQEVEFRGLSKLRFMDIHSKQYKNIKKLDGVKNLSLIEFWRLDEKNFNKFKDAESMVIIDINGMSIESFHGLEYMPKLRELNISANDSKGTAKHFTRITGVPKDHKLEKLKLSTSVTTNIEGIENFSHLKRLEFWNNRRELTDFTPLSKIKTLEDLELTVLGITDFTFLKDMPNLKKLTVSHAPITSLKGLSEAPNLEYLKIYNGKLKTIEYLDKNKQLKTLILNKHDIGKLEGLSELKKLNVLDVSRNKIKTIEGLDQSQCLEKLWVASNPISQVENVFHLPLLRELGVNRTKIDSFPNWKKYKRISRIDISKEQLDSKLFTDGYFWRYLPIKEIDMKMKESKPITQEEYKQYGCI